MLYKLILLFCVFGVLVWARKSSPAGDKSGTSLNGPVLKEIDGTDADILSVATFNIQTGKSNEGKRDINASAEVLRPVDLAGVQEVYAPSLLNLFGIGIPQSQAIAKPGNFSWLFCATRRRWLKEHRGNAVLTKLPILNWRIEMLPDYSGKSFRNMTVAKVEWQGKSFHFINTHLHTKKGREEQLDVVLHEFAKYPRAILLGDFNSRSNTPALERALRDIEISDAIAAAGLDLHNDNRIDWILTKGFKIESGEMLEKGVSDHPFYSVRLSYSN